MLNRGGGDSPLKPKIDTVENGVIQQLAHKRARNSYLGRSFRNRDIPLSNFIDNRLVDLALFHEKKFTKQVRKIKVLQVAIVFDTIFRMTREVTVITDSLDNKIKQLGGTRYEWTGPDGVTYSSHILGNHSPGEEFRFYIRQQFRKLKLKKFKLGIPTRERRAVGTATPLQLVRLDNAQPFAPVMAKKASRPMATVGQSGEVYVAHKVAGEHPNRDHVLTPLGHSFATAGMIVFGGLGAYVMAAWFGWVPWYSFADIVVVSFGSFAMIAAFDWLYDNRQVLRRKTADSWVRPELPPQAPAPVIDAKFPVNMKLRNGRPRIIPNAAPNGWDYNKFKGVCMALNYNNYQFSQNKASLSTKGLSSHAYGQLKEKWLMLDFIEPKPDSDNQFNLTDTALQYIENFLEKNSEPVA